MHRIKIILLLLLPILVKAQPVKVMAPRFIVAGESFSIQYIVEDFEEGDEFIPPSFKGFKLISGPNIYSGSTTTSDGSKPLKNISFTLEAIRSGRFMVPGPTVRINNKLIKSASVVIDVLSKKEAFEKNVQETSSEYFLRPGEDPNEKIRKNLFMKVMVNKKTCYVGEPVVATYKLYSRLTSKSDIVKNPGFYGFTVHDIISLSDNITSTERVNGKIFDVHTIRTVQLYPLQAGLFEIDPMEVTNRVEFSKSAVNKKTEQEIVEGVFEKKDPPHNENTTFYNNNISTEKITIHVNPLPEVKKPATFNGATGNFSIQTGLIKNELAKNEEGAFVITVKGKGNFTQLSAPVVEWPAGIENFEPVIKDSLDKTQIPLKGSRTFRFPFIASKPGDYSIPAVSFSFFDPDSNRYKTITANAIGVKISNKEKKELPTEQPPVTVADKKDYKSALIYGGIFLVVLIIIILQLKKPEKEKPVKQTAVETEATVSIEQLLQPAQFALVADDGNFYTLLQKSIWDHLSSQLHLSGSKMNKDDLYKTMKEKKVDETLCKSVLGILEECEAVVFTKAEFTHDKQELLNRTKNVLEQIKV